MTTREAELLELIRYTFRTPTVDSLDALAIEVLSPSEYQDYLAKRRCTCVTAHEPGCPMDSVFQPEMGRQ